MDSSNTSLPRHTPSLPQKSRFGYLIDVNASFGFWPIQRFAHHTIQEFDETYAGLDIQEVWLSAIESILYPEPDHFDTKLFKNIASFPRFRPVKTINPHLANWEISLRKAHNDYPLVALKLFPSYHGYALNLPAMERVCHWAHACGLPILIQMRLNDERNQPPILQVPGVAAEQIRDLSLRFPENVLVALGCYNIEIATLASGSRRLLADLSFLDEMIPLEKICALMPLQRYVFGSHMPFFYPESAILKFQHCILTADNQRKVASRNLLENLKQEGKCPSIT